jgi:hypothetical protein
MPSAGESSLLFAVSSWTVGSGVIPERWRSHDPDPAPIRLRPVQVLKWFRERRAEKKEDRRAIEQASVELRRVGDGPSEEQLDAAADRAASQFPNS